MPLTEIELVAAWRELIPEDIWKLENSDPRRREALAGRRWTDPVQKAGFFISAFGSLDLAIELLEGVIAVRQGTHRLEWDTIVLSILKGAQQLNGDKG